MGVRFSAALLFVSWASQGAPPPPKHFMNESGALTQPSAEPAGNIASQFLQQAASVYGLDESDFASVYLAKEYRTAHNGITHFVYRQHFKDVDVAHSEFVINVAADGSILNAGGNLFRSPAPDANAPAVASLSQSIRAAMKAADPNAAENYIPMEAGSTGKIRRFPRSAAAGGDIEGRMLWFPQDGQLQPAWQFAVGDSSGMRQAVTVNAGSAAVLETKPLVFFQQPPPPRGLVFTSESPQPNPRPGFVKAETPPYVSRVLMSFAGDPQASPGGWVTGTETIGNNVIAGKNPLAEPFLTNPVTAKSPTRDFQFPLQLGSGAPSPSGYPDAATTNLFYWMNRAHDLFWHLGFNEAAGNYQAKNFGRGGVEADPIYAYAQFGIQQTGAAVLNNSFYSNFDNEDGSPAMIAMFLGAGTNGIFSDAAYDTEVMLHEYTHGVSNRLVRNLSGHHGGAMGEAWSDFFALEFTVPEGAPVDGTYPMGDYLFQRFNVGIRTRPYSTDPAVNPNTFADLGRVGFQPAIHQDAGIWVEALWEMRANLIRQFGETEGRRRTRLLVIDGMKLSVPAPTMVDARDGILLADRANFKGESQTQIWEAFAKRGLGATAWALSTASTHVTPSFVSSSKTGAVAFAEQSYVAGEPIRIILHDANLTGDVAVVQLTSFEAGDVETVRLHKQGSIYTGVVPTSQFAPAVPGDGGLAQVPGSKISIYYNDGAADSGAKLVEKTVAVQLPYTRSQLQPLFRSSGDTSLNLRGATNAFAIYDLPWEFPFYDRGYSSVQVFTNGLLSFTLPPNFGCMNSSTLGQLPAIAPLFMQLRTNGFAQPGEGVFVSRPSADAVAFRWAGETQVSSAAGVLPVPVNFGATLYQDGRIEFNYGSGNTELSYTASPATCGATTPVVGISNGNVAALAFDYSGRSSLENAPRILWEPPTGASSVPQIRIDEPNETDTYRGILTSRINVSDTTHRVTGVYALIDGKSIGQAIPEGRNLYTLAEDAANLSLSAGTHSLKIIATNSRGGTAEKVVDFQFEAGQSRVPQVGIDLPAENADVAGNLTIRGWAAAAGLRVIGIDVLIDGVTYGEALYGLPRTDVCSGLGFTSPDCPNIGFLFSLNSATNFIPLPNGEHRLQIRVQDETGRFTSYPESPLAFQVNNGLNQPPTGVLATPANNARLSGTVLVYGYGWDPDGKVATAQLLVDGVIRATIPYGEARPSECAALANVSACPNIGFSMQWNSKTVQNGPHVLGIRLVDDKGGATILPQNAASGLTVIVDN